MLSLLAAFLLTHGDHGHTATTSYSQLVLGERDTRATIYVDLGLLESVMPGAAPDRLARHVVSNFIVRRGARRCVPALTGSDVVGVPGTLRVRATYTCPVAAPTEMKVGFANEFESGHLHVARVSEGQRIVETVELRNPYRWKTGVMSTLQQVHVFYGLGARAVLTVPAAMVLAILLIAIRARPGAVVLIGVVLLAGVALRFWADDRVAFPKLLATGLSLACVGVFWLVRSRTGLLPGLFLSLAVGFVSGQELQWNGIPHDSRWMSALATAIGFASAWSGVVLVVEVLRRRVLAGCGTRE